jgi:hypothetical protein
MQFGLNHDRNMQSPDCKSTEENSSPTDFRGSMNQPSLHYILDNSLVWLHQVSSLIQITTEKDHTYYNTIPENYHPEDCTSHP